MSWIAFSKSSTIPIGAVARYNRLASYSAFTAKELLVRIGLHLLSISTAVLVIKTLTTIIVVTLAKEIPMIHYGHTGIQIE
jgi:hypothetical protein